MKPDFLKIKSLIKQGDLSSALDLLIGSLEDSQAKIHFTTLRSSLTTLEHHKRLGIISLEEYYKEQKKIINATLEFLSDLKAAPDESIVADPFSGPDSLNYYKETLGVFIKNINGDRGFYQKTMLASILLGIAVFILGFILNDRLFHFGGGATSALCFLPFWKMTQLNHKLVLLQHFSSQMATASMNKAEQEKLQDIITKWIYKDLGI